MPISADSPLAQWNAPECPFTVAYVPRVLDDIRLAVVDAFFSLPRGGAEIGGLLLGRSESNRLTITDWQALDCEHAFGPSFTLSDNDRAQLAAMITAAGKSPRLRPVGWYHSHTRSEIFLSDADQGIHRQFFPEPWQVALVLRPHTFEPTRAGFFFRAKGRHDTRGRQSSRIHTRSAAGDSPAQPRAVGNGVAGRRERDGCCDGCRAGDRRGGSGGGAVGGRRARRESAPAPQPAIEPPPPRFLIATEPERRLPWLAIVDVLLGVAAGAGGYQTREITGRGWLVPSCRSAGFGRPAHVRPGWPAADPLGRRRSRCAQRPRRHSAHQ